nr:unnamed protein product [Callosobruchus analis]
MLLIFGVTAIVIFATILLYEWFRCNLLKNRLKWLKDIPGIPILGSVLEFGDTDETAMGIIVNAQGNSDSDYVRYVKEVCRIAATRPHTIFKSTRIFYPLSKDFFKEQQAVRHLHSVTYSVIDSRREKLEKELAMSEEERQKMQESESTGIRKKMAFLDILLRSTLDGQPLSREDIREEVDTLCSRFFKELNLKEHSFLGESFRKQISIFGDDFYRNATLSDLQEMRYLECVVKEALRLYPSVPFIGRKTNEDTMYKGK